MDLLTSFWMSVGVWTLAVLSALLHALPVGLLIPFVMPEAARLMAGTTVEARLIVITADGVMAVALRRHRCEGLTPAGESAQAAWSCSSSWMSRGT